MNNCKISIDAPKRILKGAGILNTPFLPSWVYKVNITLKNQNDTREICSFSTTLGNGIRFMDNLHMAGPDTDLCSKINVAAPDSSIGNNNVIIFANNLPLSPNSENVVSFDACLCDSYTENSTENSGSRIPHMSNIYFYGHLINGENVDSCSFISKACDYEVSVYCEDDKILPGEATKFYIYLKAGQYSPVRGVYVRSILDQGLKFIGDSSNLEPRNVYSFDKRTVLKWDVGILQPSEVKKIGYRVTLENEADGKEIKSGDILKNKINSNCIHNSAYTQCPSGCEYKLTVE